MTAIVIPPEILARRRAERDKQRQQSNAFSGTILSGILDDEEDPPSAPALPAERREPTR